jgi:uncharacterized Zn finger protein (UPF0148 family)
MSDLIDRQAAIDAVSNWIYDRDDGRSVDQLLSALPSAQPVRLKGQWMDNNACPFCGFQPWYERDIHTLSYCPNCGADMRGENDD